MAACRNVFFFISFFFFFNFLCVILLVEVGLGDVEEGAVSVCSDSEDERFPREDGQVTHHLSWVGDKQQGFLFSVDHTLVDVEQPGDDEGHTGILW